MKKLTICIMTVFMSITFFPVNSYGEKTNKTPDLSEVKEADRAQAEALVLRLNEINEMDKSEMTSMEKKELRMEVRETKKQLSDIGGGVYLSAGAIIIIVILLIILL